MSNHSYQRFTKGDRPVLAICYDFDKTLSPDDMQAQGYIQAVGYEKKSLFWEKSNEIAEKNDMDQNLAYMYMMKDSAAGKVLFTRETLMEYGAKVSLFPGVLEWFSRVRKYGEEKGVIVEHYIISSGLKEMIEATPVANEFKKIYASSFYYNEKGEAVWPAQVVNYTNKTQFLFRIEKGVLDINDSGVNDFFAPEDMRVPFRNIVYIGDSDTDIPCMKLVNSYGGHSIGVFSADTKDKTKVYKMMRDNRIKYFAETDYSEGTNIDKLIKAIIDRTASNEILENLHYRNKKEYQNADEANVKEEIEKRELILELGESPSFATTHNIIARLKMYGKWNDDEIERLIRIAFDNSQVKYILGDKDVTEFYLELMDNMKNISECANELKGILESKL